ncbi:2-hydroxyacyl-CoA dehydratase [Clostridium sp. 'deep sea']|uniref:acyl-CoA dehydratase activase-related protein n=1 Tax=Clostridium sp. 'deep sea' TaxID=2779445 RepID=UPI00189681CF|nr:acyl-CoA dehydratase activase-related protein [Clostridium sp. 'deep sea']QOR36725.1 2-hydroxyacyl-CoA dehydratase [Clostridium sp. 'deep sea']
MHIGIDIGSTTVKLICLNDNNEIIFKRYRRHYSKIQENLIDILKDLMQETNINHAKVSIAGSAGMDIAEILEIEFTQEVIAATLAVQKYQPHTDAVIEIGGEDVKVIFFDQTIEQRMNSTCAGGTGAFIDQMSKLLNITPAELNEKAKKANKVYAIASRCGVFAKTDIQALINQGVTKEDISISIFQAVVNQTIAGLAQGREFKGNICFLGGPLTFFSELRNQFIKTLKLKDSEIVFPDNSEYYIALGCALYAQDMKEIDLHDLIKKLSNTNLAYSITNRLKPLFNNELEKEQFLRRHHQVDFVKQKLSEYQDDIYIGIDAGSTTTKILVIGKNNEILHSYYDYNHGSVIEVVKQQLVEITSLKHKNALIKAVGVTGYGEELIKAAFNLDIGEVETIAHFEAAKHFMPEVDFIIDIGGQDMKCLKISNGVIESIVLNEACSSGCGSFISTFANSLNYSVEQFAELALKAKQPVDLGSRCTIFMNSSVKQAQKEGASVEDIAAGLGISVVKNALYKVLRVNSAEDLGKNIVVQGGTFYNDAILRSFELETNSTVVRPSIAGLMGAFGIALLAKKRITGSKSSIISPQEISDFSVKNTTVTCKKCNNRCSLTISTFNNGSKYISGNRCEKGLGLSKKKQSYDANKFKLNYLQNLKSNKHSQKIGIPLVLNMYENLPFWVEFFNVLGVEVVTSEISTRETYEKGQHTIPSDTVCYPAKMVHGHIESLLDLGIETIFYPCIVYNFKEKDYPKNHYNCPVVASYAEVIKNNVSRIKDKNFVIPYITLNDKKVFTKKMIPELKQMAIIKSSREIGKAYEQGMLAYLKYKKAVIDYGKEALEFANQNHKKVIVLAGRPYHIDPEVNHGITDLLSSLDIVTLTEDCVSSLADHSSAKVLNQWTYHTRLYDAAKYVADSNNNNMQLIQLVSFGCGLDAITSDETKRILEQSGKVYTQIKIDEMSNLGAVKIRIRSLISTMLEKRGE